MFPLKNLARKGLRVGGIQITSKTKRVDRNANILTHLVPNIILYLKVT